MNSHCCGIFNGIFQWGADVYGMPLPRLASCPFNSGPDGLIGCAFRLGLWLCSHVATYVDFVILRVFRMLSSEDMSPQLSSHEVSRGDILMSSQLNISGNSLRHIFEVGWWDYTALVSRLDPFL